ncbi:hypothetical protein [Arthrobacter sp. M4]|uniref:hypothetical protein n=1 Tax=Arthrobacter sp. M4 TaxID=218160 RepID=UPI001CDD0BF4|nr:hypothetical protein [Arthrobacter sp. M4]MCA4133196.1 hypothetical protein [Arthrobacter sp. M4]
MPAVAQAAQSGIQLSAGQLVFWCAVLIAAVTFTVFALRRRLVSQPVDNEAAEEPDPLFWDAFGGAVVIFPALVIPSLASPLAGLFLLLLSAATAIGTLLAGNSLDARHSRQPWRQPGYSGADVQHRELVARWSRYEIDPGQTILYPAMIDVRVPETAQLIRALHEAERSRSAVDADYPAAVERLSHALRQAERAAGVPEKL